MDDENRSSTPLLGIVVRGRCGGGGHSRNPIVQSSSLRRTPPLLVVIVVVIFVVVDRAAQNLVRQPSPIVTTHVRIRHVDHVHPIQQHLNDDDRRRRRRRTIIDDTVDVVRGGRISSSSSSPSPRWSSSPGGGPATRAVVVVVPPTGTNETTTSPPPPRSSSGRGAAVDVDGRIVTGIVVGDVSSHSRNGGGGDVYANARGRAHSCLRCCCGDGENRRPGGRGDRRSAPPTSIST